MGRFVLSLILILLGSFFIVSTEASTPNDQVIQFEGLTWTKHVRDYYSPYGDMYEQHKSKIIWNNASSELTVAENTGTNVVYAGVSIDFLLNATSFNFTLDAKFSDTLGSLGTGVVTSLYTIDSTGDWINPSGQLITSSTTYTSTTVSFANLINGTSYALFIAYIDAWPTNYHQTIYIKNINLGPEALLMPVEVLPPPGDDRIISFESQNWIKAIRKQTSPYNDMYELDKSKVTWSNSSGELTVEETQATSSVMVGVATFLKTDYTYLNITLDAKVTATHGAAIDNGVAVSIFQIGSDDSWLLPGGQKITSNSDWTTVHLSFANLVIGNNYSLFFYYGDGWGSDYDQKIFLKNIIIESKLILETNPDSPVELKGNFDGEKVILSWLPPLYNGGSDIQLYNVYRKTDSSLSFNFVSSTDRLSFSETIEFSGIYEYVVTAVNGRGESEDSNVVKITIEINTITSTTSINDENSQKTSDKPTTNASLSIFGDFRILILSLIGLGLSRRYKK